MGYGKILLKGVNIRSDLILMKNWKRWGPASSTGQGHQQLQALPEEGR
jgi:hypothetical protein